MTEERLWKELISEMARSLLYLEEQFKSERAKVSILASYLWRVLVSNADLKSEIETIPPEKKELLAAIFNDESIVWDLYSDKSTEDYDKQHERLISKIKEIVR